MSTHESLIRDEEIKLPSNRSFGLVFTVFFLFVGIAPAFFRHPIRWWSLGLSGLFLIVSFAAPQILTPLNRLWMKLGLLLHRVVSPLVLGLVFFLTVTPLAYLMRWLKKDLLRLRFDAGADTYWIHRRPPGPEPKSMIDQF